MSPASFLFLNFGSLTPKQRRAFCGTTAMPGLLAHNTLAIFLSLQTLIIRNVDTSVWINLQLPFLCCLGVIRYTLGLSVKVGGVHFANLPS